MPEVKKERSGWRDMELSERHRRWGWNCPAVDLDFLSLEYDRGEPVAIVEYKHENARPQYASHPTYQALIRLGTRAGIPVFAVRYESTFTVWKVIPLNDVAKEKLAERIEMNERTWVEFLYRLRGYNAPEALFDGIQVRI